MRKRLSTKTLTLRLIGASLLASAAIAGGLAIQMAGGHDPALGAGTATAQPRASSDSQSDGTFEGFGQSGSTNFGQSASSPGSVTTRAS
jgi:hypothetical protein